MMTRIDARKGALMIPVVAVCLQDFEMRSTIVLALCLFFSGATDLRAQGPTEKRADATQAPATQDPAAKQPSPTGSAGSVAATAREIANQANNPAAPLSQIQFRNILLPSANSPGLLPGVSEASGTVNSLQIQPVLPMGPFRLIPLIQLVKMTLPVAVTLPSPVSATGIGDLQVFDLVTIKQSWGRWGFGPALVFPTASEKAMGAGKWQAGPSIAVIYTGIQNLTAGAVLQNPISYAGSPNRPDVNNLIITPTFTENLPDGWFAGLSDYNWNFDWENDGATLLPLGVQVGKVFSVHKHAFSASIEVGGAAVRPSGSPNPGWILGFEISPIFKWHLGPGNKVRVRVKKN